MPKSAEPDVVKVKRNVLDRALAELDKIPDEDGLIKCPWDISTRPKIGDKPWADSHLQGFSIDHLVATQDYLRKDTVKYHLEILGKAVAGENLNPNVVLHDGKQKIYDGHHRLMALKLMGAEQANCWVLEID